MVCLLCDFKILLTVFNQSYNCQTSHYLGRNWLPKTFLLLPSLGITKNPSKGGFFSESAMKFFQISKSQKRIFQKAILSMKFKFQGQDSFLEYTFFLEIWRFKKTNRTFWKKATFSPADNLSQCTGLDDHLC